MIISRNDLIYDTELNDRLKMRKKRICETFIVRNE